jgi:hypothetical protein
MVEKIKKTLEDLLGELEGVCEIENVSFTYDKKNEMLTQVKLMDNALIRIYTTKSGLKIDDSVAGDKELVNKVVNKWKEFYYKEHENKNYTYNSVKQPDEIKNEIISLKDSELIVVENQPKGNGCVFLIDVIDESTHEKIKVSFYNSNKLLIQGISGPLWEYVCRIIERIENCNVTEIIKRISNESVAPQLQGEDREYSVYEASLKDILTENVYKFLSPEDKEYLISSQVLIQDNIKFPRYNAILCPACLSMEGYLKKLLVDLKIAKTHEVSNSRFNFGSIFDSLHKLQGSRYRTIRIPGEEQRQIIKKEIEDLYLKIKTFRNPTCHSGGGMSSNISTVRTFEKCKQIYEEEVLNTIKNSYYRIYR